MRKSLSSLRPGIIFSSVAKTARRISWGELILFLTGAMVFAWGKVYGIPQLGLDPSWAEGLVNATDSGKRFGIDTIFTFGPFHQLYTGQISQNLQSILLGRWLLGLATGSASVILARLSNLGWGFALTFTFWLTISDNPDASFLLLPLLFLLGCALLERTRSNALLLSATYIGVVLGIFTKLSLLGAAAPALIAGFFVRVYRTPNQKSWASKAFYVIAAALTFPILWLATAQPLEALIPYFSGPNLDIISGYSSSMQLDDPARSWQAPAYLVAMVITLYLIRRKLKVASMDRIPMFVVLTALAIISWVVLKAGMVRHDRHAVIAGYFAFSVAAIVACMSATERSDSHKAAAIKIPPLIVAPILTGLSITSQYQNAFRSQPLNSSNTIIQNTKLLLASSFSSRHQDYLRLLRRHQLESLSKQAEKFPIPHDKKTDILNWEISDLIANGITYSPRPVFQSYSAYTPRLQALNKKHFTGPNRPDYVILMAQSIDGRSALEMDAPSILMIAKNYTFHALGSKGSLVYRSSSPPNTTDISPSHYSSFAISRFKRSSKDSSFTSDWFPLPEHSQGSYLKIKLNPSIPRKFLTVLYKFNPLTLEVRSSSDTIKTVRLLDQPINIIALNPTVKNNADLRNFISALQKPVPSRSRESDGVTQIRIRDDSFFPSVNSINVTLLRR